MKSLSESIVNKSTRDSWESELRACAPKCGRDEALSYEIHEHFPQFVFVELDKENLEEKGRIMSARARELHAERTPEEILESRRFNYCPGEHIAFMSGEEFMDLGFGLDHEIGWFTLTNRMRSVVRDYMRRRRPKQEIIRGIEGWVLPLCSSDAFVSVDDFNEYMHNLMFWESMIDANQIGPLMQRYAWVAQRLYEHVYDMEEAKRRVWQEYPEIREKNTPTIQKLIDLVLKRKNDVVINVAAGGIFISDNQKNLELEKAIAEEEEKAKMAEKRIKELMEQRLKMDEMLSRYHQEANILTAQIAEMQNVEAMTRIRIDELKQGKDDKK